MIRTQISFDEALYREAKRVAKRERISLAELCRKGIREVIAREKAARDKPWMRYAGIFDSGDPRASETIDEVVYGRQEP